MSAADYYTTNVVQDFKKDNTGLLRFDDGSLVEVQVPEYKAGEISAKGAQRTASNLSVIEGILYNIAKPIVKTAKRISEVENISVTAEVEIGLSFEAEGGVYVSKNKSNANLVVKLSIQASSSAIS